MTPTRKQLIGNLNDTFNRRHFAIKPRRSIESLYRILLYLSEGYKNEIRKLQHTNRNLRINERELVACSIAGRSSRIAAFGTSHKQLEESSVRNILRIAMVKLGQFGRKSKLNTNIIGKCAEIKAANNILTNDNQAMINSIEFTKAIRPRTSEPMKRCENCIEIFGDE